jgi:hypothetical protein
MDLWNYTSAYLDKYLSAELSYIELPVFNKKSSLVFFFFTLPGWLSIFELRRYRASIILMADFVWRKATSVVAEERARAWVSTWISLPAK